jgi:hypothetical protein
MTKAELQNLVDAAMKRIIAHINRSAGQQKRQMISGWRKRQIENAKDKK